MKKKFLHWIESGTPWIWANAGAVTICLLMVVGLLLVLTVKGMVHFWPADVVRADYSPPSQSSEVQSIEIIGEFVESERVPASQIIFSGIPVDASADYYERNLVKLGNRDLTGSDFSWVLTDFLHDLEYPQNVLVLERME